MTHVCELHSTVMSARRFPVRRDAPRAARRFVAKVLGGWDVDVGLVEDAELVVSELATNAVVHARVPFTVLARDSPPAIELEVRDASPDTPGVREGEPMRPSGRGLKLVAELASRWGIEPSGAGKLVWAELRPD